MKIKENKFLCESVKKVSNKLVKVKKIVLRQKIIECKNWNKNICIKVVFPFIITLKKQVAKLLYHRRKFP